MKRKILCIALALLMCAMVTVSTVADGTAETPPDREPITATFGLTHISGSTYRMWTIINNPTGASVNVTLTLYNISYSPISSIGTTSTNTLIYLYKNLNLSSGTYHLILTYSVDGSLYSSERTYTI